jgi:uncharacterized membrane protein YciS (DUF1049 family)
MMKKNNKKGILLYRIFLIGLMIFILIAGTIYCVKNLYHTTFNDNTKSIDKKIAEIERVNKHCKNKQGYAKN